MTNTRRGQASEPVAIPSRNLISEQKGIDHVRQLSGLPGKFCFVLFVKRFFTFHGQHIQRATGDGPNGFAFYERLDSPQDLSEGVDLWKNLCVKGMEFSNIPGYDLVVEIFPSIYSASHDGTVPMPETDEKFIGHHAVLPIDQVDGRIFFTHSWGRKWGADGVGSFSMEYIERHWGEAWATRLRQGPRPQDVHRASDLGPSAERKRLVEEHQWNHDNRAEFVLLHRGRRTDVFARWLVLIDGSICLQSVAMARSSEGSFAVGWMHIRGSSIGPVVEEFFVWPPYRMRQIGTMLAGQTLLFAALTSWRDKDLRWRFTEADAEVQNRVQNPPKLPRWLKFAPRNTGQRESFAISGNLLALLETLARTQVSDGVTLTVRSDKSRKLFVVDSDSVRPTHGVVVRIS